MVNNIIEFERRFERQLVAFTKTPWIALKIQILDNLYQTLKGNLTPTQQTSYLEELKPHWKDLFLQVSSGENDIQAIDPKLPEKLLSRALAGKAIVAEREFVIRIVTNIGRNYLRLLAFEDVLTLLKHYGFLNIAAEKELVTPNEDQTAQARLTGFLEQLENVVPEGIYEKLTRVVEDQPYRSSTKSLKGLFVVTQDEYAAGILAAMTLNDLKVSSRMGLDQVRIATHLVDESDILAEQTREVCRFLHKKYQLKPGECLRLEYSIDQPSSLLVGNSVGVALTILGSIGLQLYHRNRSFQPMVYNDVAFTGAVDSTGKVLPVDEKTLRHKIEAAFFGPVRAVVVPAEQKDIAQMCIREFRNRYPHREPGLIPVDNMVQLEEKREVIHLQRRKVKERVEQFVREYANSVTYSIMGFIILLGLGFWFGIVKHPAPELAEPYKDGIAIKNKYGFKLWRSDNGTGDVKVPIRDLDNDGNMEILINYGQRANDKVKGKLVCYSNRGIKLWDVKIGKEVKYGDNLYPEFFTISKILTEDLDDDNNLEIITINQSGMFPNQLLIINHKGEIISEYWHSGGIPEAVVADLFPENDNKEILLCGRNNEYKAGVILLIDPYLIRGQSPQEEYYYTNQGTEWGNEIFYIRFPLTHFIFSSYRDKAEDLKLNEHGNIKLLVKNTISEEYNAGGTLSYVFDRTFRVKFVDLHDSYYKLYSLVYPDRPKLPYNDMETLTYFRTVNYWDGDKWVQEPSINKRYLEMLEKENSR